MSKNTELLETVRRAKAHGHTVLDRIELEELEQIIQAYDRMQARVDAAEMNEKSALRELKFEQKRVSELTNKLYHREKDGDIDKSAWCSPNCTVCRAETEREQFEQAEYDSDPRTIALRERIAELESTPKSDFATWFEKIHPNSLKSITIEYQTEKD